MFRAIESLTETCSACPTQYEGQLANGDYIYIRYRFGTFIIQESCDDVGFRTVYHREIGDSLDGVMSFEEVLLELAMAGYTVRPRQILYER